MIRVYRHSVSNTIHISGANTLYVPGALSVSNVGDTVSIWLINALNDELIVSSDFSLLVREDDSTFADVDECVAYLQEVVAASQPIINDLADNTVLDQTWSAKKISDTIGAIDLTPFATAIALTDGLALKANLAGDTFTGNITVPGVTVSGALNLNHVYHYIRRDGTQNTYYTSAAHMFTGTGGNIAMFSTADQSASFYNKVQLAAASVLNWSSGSSPTLTPDAGFARDSAGVVKVTDGATGLGTIRATLGRFDTIAGSTSAYASISIYGGGNREIGVYHVKFNGNDVGLQRNTAGYLDVTNGTSGTRSGKIRAGLLSAEANEALDPDVMGMQLRNNAYVAGTGWSVYEDATDGALSFAPVGGSRAASLTSTGEVVLAKWVSSVDADQSLKMNAPGYVAFTDNGGTERWRFGTSLDFRLGDANTNGGIRWSASTNPGGTKDLGLFRASAGVLAITDGSTGWGSLKATTITGNAGGTLGAGNPGLISVGPSSDNAWAGSIKFQSFNAATYTDIINSTGGMFFRIQGTEKVRINSTGLSVGGVAASYPLHLKGTTADTIWYHGAGYNILNMNGGDLVLTAFSSDATITAKRRNYLKTNNGSTTTMLLDETGKVSIGTTSLPTETLDVNGTIRSHHLKLLERSADPSDPTEGNSIIWQSDGTGTGDDGDILIKVTAGGVTKTITLVDFSAF